MEFSRQEYWSGLSFNSPGDLSNPGIEPRSPTLQVDALLSEPPRKLHDYMIQINTSRQLFSGTNFLIRISYSAITLSTLSALSHVNTNKCWFQINFINNIIKCSFSDSCQPCMLFNFANDKNYI